MQNHLPVATHFTTEAGVWMLQYSHFQKGSSVGAAPSTSPESSSTKLRGAELLSPMPHSPQTGASYASSTAGASYAPAGWTVFVAPGLTSSSSSCVGAAPSPSASASSSTNWKACDWLSSCVAKAKGCDCESSSS